MTTRLTIDDDADRALRVLRFYLADRGIPLSDLDDLGAVEMHLQDMLCDFSHLARRMEVDLPALFRRGYGNSRNEHTFEEADPGDYHHEDGATAEAER